MTFANSLTRLPRPFEPERGQEALLATPWATGDMAKLIKGAAGCSPYLRGLLLKEGDWLASAVEASDQALTLEIARCAAVASADLPVALRQAKRRVALLTAIADLGGVWSLEEVTTALTNFADGAVNLALRAALEVEVRRGKLPGADKDTLDTAGGLVVLAMGKMGAHELNYSSDIDLICLFDETRYAPSDYQQARSSLVRATRKMASILSEITADGYVFRTDLRLRPDPAVTPVCLSMEAAERYYESLGRTWERAAYIKARPCAGDVAAGDRFLLTLQPFVWRKHLDFAAIQDAHDMRLRYRTHKGQGGPITLRGHNMKLGRGGIREIEFFTQTRQLIAGGRDPALRQRGTVSALEILSQKGWVPTAAAQTLTAHYRAHREIEHRLQMVGDVQTHALPTQDEGFERLAAFVGLERKSLETQVYERLTEVHDLTEGFFAPDVRSQRPALPQVTLDTSGYSARWRRYPALRSSRAVDLFERLKPEILARLSVADRPEQALAAFDGFLAGLPAGVQVFSLFEANPSLVDLLIDVVSVSPDLARYLSRNASVFDAVIGGAFFDPWPGLSSLKADLAREFGRAGDYERQLDAVRRWTREWNFRTGVHLLRGLIGADQAGRQYADIAEAVMAELWPVVLAEFARKHGDMPGRGAVVLGMGSLGAGRLHGRSDLDVIVIYDPDGVEMSTGRKPLVSRVYYARLTQALVTAVSTQTAEGRLFEIDMRLRPSGNQGPVATSLEAFRTYQRETAWTWEHLAQTRARVIAGSSALATDVEGFRQDLLSDPHDATSVLTEVAKMRARIEAAKGEALPLDPKLGRGRLQDIDLFAQAGLLVSGTAQRATSAGLQAAASLGWISQKVSVQMMSAYRLFQAVQVGARLIRDGALIAEDLGDGGADFLSRLTGATDLAHLQAELTTQSRFCAAIIDASVPYVRAEG